MMKVNYTHRIAPDDSDYACKHNERLVTATNDKENAGVDPENYTLYITKNVEVVAKEVYAFIDFAKSHPELRFIVQLYGLEFAVIGQEVLIPLFARAWDVENVLLTERVWKTIEKQEIENREGAISFAGVAKRPVMVDYTVFSNSIRYGVARSVDAHPSCYFAVHGSPSRNDDYFTIARVTEQEYDEMMKVYAPMGSQSNPTAEMFRNKYVENHTQVYEGWRLPDVLWV